MRSRDGLKGEFSSCGFLGGFFCLTLSVYIGISAEYLLNLFRIVKDHPTPACLVLNAGIQRRLHFARPEALYQSPAPTEIYTNYTSYIAMTAAFLPHLRGQEGKKQTALIAVSSGLALVPLPRCANYCATKAALHALMWSLRAQLAADEASRGVRVIEIVPPAVQVCRVLSCPVFAMLCYVRLCCVTSYNTCRYPIYPFLRSLRSLRLSSSGLYLPLTNTMIF